MLSLLKFSTALGNSLIHANKPVHVNRSGRPSKRENTQSKRASVPTPCSHIRYNQTGYWAEPVDKKN